MTRRPRFAGTAVVAAALAAAVAASFAGRMANAADADVMRFEPEFLLRGTIDGVAVADDGSFTRAASFEEPRATGDDGPGLALWDLATGPDGRIHVVGGPPGALSKRGPRGPLDRIAGIPDPLATAAVLAQNGDWWVAGAPSGTIWAIGADGRAEALCSTGSRYVWALVRGRDGRVRAATGDPARLLGVDEDGDLETLFESSESHLTAAAEDATGHWWVAGSGRGRLYRLGADGEATVMYDDELEEVVDFAPFGGGWVLALTRRRSYEAPPRLRIRLPTSDDAEDPLTDAAGVEDDLLEGTVEADDTPVVPAGTPLGRVVHVHEDGRVDTWWESTDAAPSALTADGSRVYLGLGEPATLLERVGGRWARLGRWPESSVSSLFADDGRLVVATSSPPRIRGRSTARDREGSYLSPAADAGAPVRWGRLRWKTDGDVRGARFATRTGNAPVPDATWSEWSPELTDPSGSPILASNARYLQWRVRWSGVAGGRIRDVSASYRVRNRAPVWTALAWDVPRADADRVEWRWEALDPDGDTLAVAIEWRPTGSSEWSELVTTVAESSPTEPLRSRRSGRLSKAWSELPEGVYEIRGRAGDQPGQPAGAGRVAFGPVRTFVVDRSPPELLWEGSRLRVSDRHSPIVRVEAWEGGLPRFRLLPVDGVADGREESFDVRGEYTADRGWTFRAVDASGNVQEIPGPER